MQALLTEGLLKNHPFLKDATASFLNQIEEFATEAWFEAGEVIFDEGDYADRFFLILEGKIALETGPAGKGGIVVQILGPGDALGWSWLFPPFQWHFRARVLEPCHAIEMSGASLLIRSEEDCGFGHELLKRVSRQVIQRLQVTRNRLVQELRRKM